MKRIITLQILLLSAIVFCFYQITRAGTEEIMSALTGTAGSMSYTMVYQYPLMNRDGTVTQFKLIKFNKENCVEIDGQRGCVGGFTEAKSNFTRKTDTEHYVDTTESINLTFTPGKIPKVDEENVLHELVHSNFLHYMSRPVCETNYRYSECQEALAYNYTYLLKQVRQLQKQGRIKLI